MQRNKSLSVQEGAQALGEQQGAALATSRKDAALARLQATEIGRIAGLVRLGGGGGEGPRMGESVERATASR